MEIHVVSTLNFSRDKVFNAYRDNLAEMVPYLPNINKIEVVSREEPEPNIVKFENHWYADAPIPKLAQAIIKPDMLKWFDFATWNSEANSCDWLIQTFFMKEAVHCKGKNTFKEIDDNTMELTIHGDLSLNPKAIGVPRLLAGKLTPQLEKFIIALITPNFHKTNSAIEQFLNQ